MKCEVKVWQMKLHLELPTYSLLNDISPDGNEKDEHKISYKIYIGLSWHLKVQYSQKWLTLTNSWHSEMRWRPIWQMKMHLELSTYSSKRHFPQMALKRMSKIFLDFTKAFISKSAICPFKNDWNKRPFDILKWAEGWFDKWKCIVSSLPPSLF